MKTCPTCGLTILFGGVRKDGIRYCSAECYRENLADMENGEKIPDPDVKDGLVHRFLTGFAMVLALTASIGTIVVFVGSIPKLVSISILILVSVVGFLLYGYYWLMGGGAEKYSNRQITALQRLDFQTPVRHLRFRSGVYLTRYRFKGKKVAFFDHGGCTLEVGGDKSYSYSCWGLDKVDTPVLRPGSAELATIKDYHETVIDNDEEATSTLYGFDGTTTYYKEGVTEVVAHSETPFRRKGERVIACGKRTCMAKYRKHGKVELTNYRTGRPIGHTREFLFWGHTTFDPPIPLLDGIFINLLLALDGTDCHPCQDV